jgi:FkbM family methyltransferase
LEARIAELEPQTLAASEEALASRRKSENLEVALREAVFSRDAQKDELEVRSSEFATRFINLETVLATLQDVAHEATTRAEERESQIVKHEIEFNRVLAKREQLEAELSSTRAAFVEAQQLLDDREALIAENLRNKAISDGDRAQHEAELLDLITREQDLAAQLASLTTAREEVQAGASHLDNTDGSADLLGGQVITRFIAPTPAAMEQNSATLALSRKQSRSKIKAQLGQRKDRSMRRMFDGLLTSLNPDIICDIGSLDGAESAHFRKILPTAQIYLFEASKSNFDEFIRPRQDLHGVTIENLAISDRDGLAFFNEMVLPDDPTNAFWMRGAGSLLSRTDGYETRSVEVDAVRLDSYFSAQLAEDKNFILWIDIEGAVQQLFAGGDGVIRNTLALRVEVERKTFWEGEMLAPEIISYLETRDFSLFGESSEAPGLGQSDLLFISDGWLDMVA